MCVVYPLMITGMILLFSDHLFFLVLAEELEQAGQKLEAKVYQTLQLQVDQQIYVIII